MAFHRLSIIALAAGLAGAMALQTGTSLAASEQFPPGFPPAAVADARTETGLTPDAPTDVDRDGHGDVSADTSAPRIQPSSRGADRRASGLQPLAVTESSTGVQVTLPVRPQRDGSPFAEANCGVAALAMVLEGHGVYRATAALREQANQVQPPRTFMDGLAWETLVSVAGRHGLESRGLYAQKGYRRWTLDEIRAELAAGRPVVTLVDYRSLPLNQRSRAATGHYIVLTGFEGDTFTYNDSLPYTGNGLGIRIDGNDLLRAQDRSWPPRSAIVLALPDAAPVPAGGAGAAEPASAPAPAAAPAIAPTAVPAVAPERLARDPGRWFVLDDRSMPANPTLAAIDGWRLGGRLPVAALADPLPGSAAELGEAVLPVAASAAVVASHGLIQVPPALWGIGLAVLALAAWIGRRAPNWAEKWVERVCYTKLTADGRAG